MKRALFLMIGCLVGLVMIANPITKEEAQQKAVQFLSKKQSNRALAPRLKPVSLHKNKHCNKIKKLSHQRVFYLRKSIIRTGCTQPHLKGNKLSGGTKSRKDYRNIKTYNYSD